MGGKNCIVLPTWHYYIHHDAKNGISTRYSRQSTFMVYNLTIISLFYPFKQKNVLMISIILYIYAPWYIYLHHWVAGWWFTYPSEKYESMGRIIPYMKWTKKCLKPPSSMGIYLDIKLGYVMI